MIINEFESMRKQAVVTVVSRHFPGGTSENYDNLGHVSRSPGRKFNRNPLKRITWMAGEHPQWEILNATRRRIWEISSSLPDRDDFSCSI
jgi:hypothetical protein